MYALIFLPYKGKINSIDDLYMIVLWPAAIGKPDDYVLFDRDDTIHPKRYTQNNGLDANQDGKITKAAAAVRESLVQGQLPKNEG